MSRLNIKTKTLLPLLLHQLPTVWKVESNDFSVAEYCEKSQLKIHFSTPRLIYALLYGSK